MKRQPRILAGTALGLLMASAPLAAAPLSFGGGQAGAQDLSGARILLVQDCPEGQECAPNSRRQQRQQQGEGEEEGKPRQQRREQGGGEQEQEAPQRQRREQPQEEQAPEPTPRAQREQAEPEAPRQQRRQQPAEEAAPAEEAPAERPRREQRQQEQAPEAEKPRAQPEEAPQRPRREQRQEPEAQQEPAPRPQPGPVEAQPEPRPAQPEQEQPAPRPEAEQPAEPDTPRRQQRQEQPSGTEAPAPEPRPAEPTPETAPTPSDAPTPARPRPAEGEQPTPSERPTLPGAGEQGGPPALPGAGEQGERPATPEQPQGEAPRPEGEAPLLDSQKERPGRDAQRPDRQRPDGQRPDGQPGERPGPDGQRSDGQAPEQERPRVDQGPPPADDRAAQEAIRPERVRPVEEEQGRRIDRRPELRDRERRDGADIVRELGDRLIIEFGGQTRVESSDRPRMTRDARDVYYEELPRGRTRETIVRPNGNQIVTVRNRYGDIVQRSRITPDGREYVLSYVDEDNYDRIDDGRDAGYDLPPLRLDIPREQYILESEPGRSSDDYYTFLEQPPVERVERLYSVDEVKRSARVRDIARRIDLDTLTFEFGSATIPEAEITKLEGVAQAMERLLEKNPAETFLIEGHTDAVGSDVANLALSDRRAEAVANALTNVFGIAPENLSTQGYGEQYLKVNTSAPERENRRVAIRRITALVAPMASAN